MILQPSKRPRALLLNVFPATLLLALLFSINAFAARTERLIDAWRPTNYNVSLTFNETLTEITSARAEITVLSLNDSLSLVDLDFGELPVDEVTVNNQTTPYQRSAGRLDIKLSNPMRKGASFVIEFPTTVSPKTVWS